MTLDDICQNVRELSIRHGWDQSDPLTRMLHLISEIGEVAAAVALAQRMAHDPAELESARNAAGQEIFDAIWNLCALANTLDIDITTAAHQKVRLNAQRTWA